ncbi:hypothetical protein [Alkaliphilus metalliredigens]|uniref:hypothetical protein n=1 Tax=Alkaliphilus metalliredigens TaxID=208226 RepID=UPI0012EE6EF6|nr:hypothetical protein [Alkaliphilus metalliredigens]
MNESSKIYINSAASSEEVSVSLEEQTISIEKIAKYSHELQEMPSGLEIIINKFKL